MEEYHSRGSAAARVSCVEIVEVDDLGVERVGGAERDGAGAVQCVRFKSVPREMLVFDGVATPHREVAAEVDGRAEYHEIDVTGRARRRDLRHRGGKPVGAVGSAQSEDVAVRRHPCGEALVV